MRKSTPISKLRWTSVPGALSVLLTLEFWVHMLVPFMRKNVRFPFWPYGAFIELLIAAFLAALAAIFGSRLWWVVVLGAIGTVAVLLSMFAG